MFVCPILTQCLTLRSIIPETFSNLCKIKSKSFYINWILKKNSAQIDKRKYLDLVPFLSVIQKRANKLKWPNNILQILFPAYHNGSLTAMMLVKLNHLFEREITDNVAV